MNEGGEPVSAMGIPNDVPAYIPERTASPEYTAGITRLRGISAALDKYQTDNPHISTQDDPTFRSLSTYVNDLTTDPHVQRLLTQMEQKHSPTAVFRYGEAWHPQSDEEANANRQENMRRITYVKEKARITSELVRRLDRPGFSYDGAVHAFLADGLRSGLTDTDITSRILFAMTTHRVNRLLRETLATTYRNHQTKKWNVVPIIEKVAGKAFDPDRQHILNHTHAQRCVSELPDTAYHTITGKHATDPVTATLGHGYISFHLETGAEAGENQFLPPNNGLSTIWTKHPILRHVIAYDSGTDPFRSEGIKRHEIIHITNGRLEHAKRRAQEFLRTGDPIFSRPVDRIPSSVEAVCQDMSDYKQKVIDYRVADEIIAEACTPNPARSNRDTFRTALSISQQDGGAYAYAEQLEPKMRAALEERYKRHYAAGMSFHGSEVSHAYGQLLIEVQHADTSELYKQAHTRAFDRQNDEDEKWIALTSAYTLADTGMDPVQMAVVFDGVPLQEWDAIAEQFAPRPAPHGEPAPSKYPRWFSTGQRVTLEPFSDQVTENGDLLPGATTQWVLTGSIREGGYELYNSDTDDVRILTYNELKEAIR